MMWSTIANLKENLNRIALDVHDDDDDEELGICSSLSNGANGGEDDALVSDRRNSHSFAHAMPASRSSRMNGIDYAYKSEMEQFKAEIKRLQDSEREIKALSVNYASLLKEKEDQISRLNKENGSLKQNLESTSAAMFASKNDSSRASINGTNALKGVSNQLPNRPYTVNGIAYKQDGIMNGVAHSFQSDIVRSKMATEHSTFPGKKKELADFPEENNGSPMIGQGTDEMKKLRIELEREQEILATLQLKLQEEQQLNATLQEKLNALTMNKETVATEMSKVQEQLNEKISEIERLQTELKWRDGENFQDTVQIMKKVIAKLEKENTSLKMEKNELESALEINRNSVTDRIQSDASQTMNKHPSTSNENVDASGTFPGKKEMELSLQKLEKDLREAWVERDKAQQELARLKQHLIEKESEESEKMDEDSKIIEELRQNNEYRRTQILHLEKALKQAIAKQEEVKMTNSDEIQKSKELINDLNKKLANCVSAIDAKNIELLNLQTALGQYYAEIEAKEHLEGNLARAREDLAKLSQMLKDADEREQNLKREKEEILTKHSLAEGTLGEWKSRVNKLEEDNSKLRRALEQSMTRLNRMSVDSDFLVDRRIVIKLLVTYFQRNHSKEVLDLMVRMLGFSEEEKQRIGAAQQGPGKGVVRGVLGLPGRLVGGILGGSSESSANMASENHSFADLWVDFLLKENEEREKREAMEGGRNANGPSLPISDKRPSSSDPMSGFSKTNFSSNQSSS